MGMYENPLYENGTKELYEFLKQEKKKVVVCGGDGASSSKNIILIHTIFQLVVVLP